jgi:hypothetical protein
MSSSSSYGPGAPAIYPTSSCSLAWRWVLRRPCSSSPGGLGASAGAAVAGARSFGGPGTPCCCSGIVDVHRHHLPFRRHQRRPTCQPPHEQLLMGLDRWCVVWVVLGPVGSFGCAGVRFRRWRRRWVVVVGSCGHSSLWWGPAHSSSSSVPAVIHSPYPTCM